MSVFRENWPADLGEIGNQISTTSWTDTSVGPLEEWSPVLQSALDICLLAKQPISICWGEEFTLFYNETWAKSFGDQHHSALGKSAREVYSYMWDSIGPKLEHVLTSGEPLKSKSHFVATPGSQQENGNYFDFSFTPIRDESGSVVGTFNIAHPVSDKTHALYQPFFENVPGAFIILQPDTYEVVAASNAYLEATMTERSDIVGKKLFDIFPEEPSKGDAQKIKDSLERVKTKSESDALPVIFYPIPRSESQGGGFEERWWSPVNSPVPNPEGGIDYIIHRVKDVTPIIRQLQEEGREQDLLDRLTPKNSDRATDVILRGRELEHAKKRSDQLLRESEEKYRTLFESVDQAYCIIELLFDENDQPVNYRFLEVNPAFEKHTGLEDTEGKTIRELVPEYQEEIWIETYANILRTDNPIRFERYSQAVDKHFDVYAFPFGDPGSKKVAILFQDITQRKQNENLNAWLGAIVSDSDDAIISKNLDGEITSWNESAERLFGYTAEEAVGQNITMIIPNKLLHEETEIQEQLKRGKRIDHFETVRERKDGSQLDVSLTISPVRDPSGEIVGASKIARDITARIKTQKERDKLYCEVEAERQRLANIFRHAPSFMCIMQGPDHVIVRANELFRQLVDHREIIGKAVREAIPEAEEHGFIELLDEVYETGEPFTGADMEIVLQSPSADKATKHFLDFVYQPLYDPDGSISGIFAQGIDMTERNRAKKELEEINETLEERVEERTAVLQSYQNQLRSLASKLNKAEEEERRRLGAELHDNLGQMLAVARMKLNFLETANFPETTSEEIVDLSEIVQEALTYTRELMTELKPPPVLNKEDIGELFDWLINKMAKYNLAVSIQSDGRPKLLSEEVRTTLYQCVKELLFNVVKHAETDEASIFISQEDGMMRVAVEDEGRGCDIKEKQPEPTDDGGFGLFNINERMEFLGGSLDVISEPGKGTKAILCVPLKKQEVPDTTVDSEQPTPQQQFPAGQTREDHKIKVLLVDDHEMVRRGFRKLIEAEEDMTVIAEAANGEEAVNLAHETSPNIIVMDVNMPGMDGIEATKRITTAISNIRVIGLSLHDREEVIRNMQEAGASAYLTKDEAFETLCATIRSEGMTVKEK